MKENTGKKRKLTAGVGVFSGTGRFLFPDSVAFPADVGSDVKPKGNEEIKNDRRAHGCKGKINEINPDSARGNAHFCTQIAANTKHGNETRAICEERSSMPQ